MLTPERLDEIREDCEGCACHQCNQDYLPLIGHIDAQAARIAELEHELSSPEITPHWCRDEHVIIRHRDSEHERCPLCRANDELAAEREKREKAEACLSLQRKAWSGVSKIELDGPLVDFADAQIKRIDAALATSEVID